MNSFFEIKRNCHCAKAGRSLLLLLLFFTAAPSVHAWQIVNTVGDVDVRAQVKTTFDPRFGLPAGDELAPLESYTCPVAHPDCTPAGPGQPLTVKFLLEVDLQSGGFATGIGDFYCQVTVPPDGTARFLAQFRRPFEVFKNFVESSVAYPRNYHCVAEASDGTVVDYSDPYAQGRTSTAIDDMTPANRNVRFLVTGDPQYQTEWISDNNMGFTLANVTLDNALNVITSSAGTPDAARGLIVTGDLTHQAIVQDWPPFGPPNEFAFYQDAISRAPQFVFDGLGNHDTASVHNCPPPFPIPWCSEPDFIRQYVGRKARATAHTKRDAVSANGLLAYHYSWDWHDVHFVQLNLSVADCPTTELDCGERDSLSFLIDDLARNVGSSGRPVILIHHYGFEPGVLNWGWSADSLVEYWNAIADYNISAILTGHIHLAASDTTWADNQFNQFDLPPGAVPRSDMRTEIDTFNTASAHGNECWIFPALCGGGGNPDPIQMSIEGGVYLDVTIGECNMTLERRDQFGVERTAVTIDGGDGDGDATGGLCDNCPIDWNYDQLDSDGDNVGDGCDNCQLTPNREQRDTNGDGIGNACDADLNGDCTVNFGDLAALKAAFNPNPYNPDADFDGNGLVNFGDLAKMKATFFNGENPGPGPGAPGNSCD